MGSAVARRGGQRPPTRCHKGTSDRPLSERARSAPPPAGHPLRRRRDSLRRRRQAGRREEEFDALGPVAREFHLKLLSTPVKPAVHLRRLLGLVRLYGRKEVLAAISQALQYQTYDAAYVEALLLQERRRCELPSPMPLQPKRRELIEDIHLQEPDPAHYDRLCGDSGDEEPQS